MDFGANAWIWGSPLTTEKIEALAPKVSAMGFDEFEIPIEERGTIDYEQAGAILDEHDLSAGVITAMTDERDLLSPTDGVPEQGREYVRHCIDAADTLGARTVIGPIYSAVGRTWKMTPDERAATLDRLIPQLRELSAYAADRDVVLCIEPLNRFETSVINTVEQGVELVDRVDSEACGLLLDTFHMNIEEDDLGDAIRTAGSRVQHVHACGSHRGAPGSGTIQWDRVAEALDDVDYDDSLVIESFTPEVESIARAAAIWRPLAASQDDLAEDGLAFLEQTFD
ncbi:sugar phosphate isomerase/epimerase family protein [Natrialbaceae archaeon A-arb3/5]